MKITKQTLKQIINEEIEKIHNEMMDSNYAESYKLDLTTLEHIANLAREGSMEEMGKLRDVIQIIGRDLTNHSLDPSGEHAMFYYQNIGVVDPDADMDALHPEDDQSDIY